MTENFPKATKLKNQLKKPMDSTKLAKISNVKIPENAKIPKPSPKEPKKGKKAGNKGKQGKEPRQSVDPELLKMILENKGMPIEELIKKAITMGKTTSSLKGVRETYEDILNIGVLSDLVLDMRDKKRKGGDDDEDGDQSIDPVLMMNLLQKLKNQGGNGGNGGNDPSQGNNMMNMMQNGNIDPITMMMMMGMGNSKNNNMGQLMMMINLFNMMSQQNQNASQNGNGSSHGDMNTELLKMISQELQKFQSQQVQQTDPMQMMMMKLLVDSSKNSPKSDTTERLIMAMQNMQQNNLTQQLQMIMQQSNDKFERIAEMLAGAMHSDPEGKLMKTMTFFRELQGDSRQRTKDELDYELRKKELELKQHERFDMLDREERQLQRDEEKSSRIIGTAQTILDKFIGDGLSNVVNDIMKARKEFPRNYQQPQQAPQQPIKRFTASDLDDL